MREWESDPVLGHGVAWISEGDEVLCLLFRQDASAMLSYFRDYVGLSAAGLLAAMAAGKRVRHCQA